MPQGGGAGYSQSESEQKSQSLGPLGSASGTIRGSLQNVLANLLSGTGRTGQGEGLLAELQGRTQNAPTYSLPSLTQTGLYPAQDQAFRQAVQQAVSGLSGNYAQRGMLTPDAIGAIAGSAAQNVAPQFAPLIGQNIQAQAQVPLQNEDIMRGRLADLFNALGITISGLGGESTSYGSSKSMSVQAQVSSGKKGTD